MLSLLIRAVLIFILFPYTTLFRSVICFGLRTDFRTQAFPGAARLMELADNVEKLPTMCRCGSQARSEEHTSELQSRGHLVCRLLLEKKKKSSTQIARMQPQSS